MQSPFDYGETYAPVAKFSTIRSILAHAAIHDLPIRNLDIGNAYLNSFLPENERCFMEAPPRYGRDGYVCMLIKSLYGLKSAGRLWNDTIDKWFKKMGYKQSIYDPCLYYYKNGDRFIYVALYVDDCIYVGDDEYMRDFEHAISAEFKVRLLGNATTFLGMEINKNSQKGTVEITQKKYIKNIANKLRPRCGSAALASIVGQGGCGMELALRFGISRGGGLVPCRHCLRESPSFPGVFGTCLLAPCGICIPLSGPGHYRPRGVVAHCCLRARSQGLVRTRPGSGCVIRHRCSHNVAVF